MAASFYLLLDDYLAQWFLNRCGGIQPIRLPKGSLESLIVQKLARPKSEGACACRTSDSELEILFPESKFKPSETYNHFPDSAKKVLIKAIRHEFDLCLFNSIVIDLFPKDIKREIIYAWMDLNGIDCTETNFFAVDKRYSRLREKLIRNSNAKSHRN